MTAPSDRPKHPAKFSRAILEVVGKLMWAVWAVDERAHRVRVIDPMAGVGGLASLALPGVDVYLNELEPEWAGQCWDWRPAAVTVGDARTLPYPDGYFHGLITSPPYANRMGDHANWRDDSVRNTYKSKLGVALHPDNLGRMQWVGTTGDQFRRLMTEAMAEYFRVLMPGGVFMLNVSDHIRRGQLMHT